MVRVSGMGYSRGSFRVRAVGTAGSSRRVPEPLRKKQRMVPAPFEFVADWAELHKSAVRVETKIHAP